MSLGTHMERVLWSQDQISKRVSSLASEITSDFATHSCPPLILGVATGAFLFLADLVRLIPLSLSTSFAPIHMLRIFIPLLPLKFHLTLSLMSGTSMSFWWRTLSTLDTLCPP